MFANYQTTRINSREYNSDAYYYSKMGELSEFNKYFMTLDIGGGTTDVSVLRCTGLHCQVLGGAGNSSLGGIDFDNVIVDIN